MCAERQLQVIARVSSLCILDRSSTLRDSYRFSHIVKTLRALQSSTKTSLRIDDEGLLSLQFMMPSSKARGLSEGPQAFIEFQVCLSNVLNERLLAQIAVS